MKRVLIMAAMAVSVGALAEQSGDAVARQLQALQQQIQQQQQQIEALQQQLQTSRASTEDEVSRLVTAQVRSEIDAAVEARGLAQIKDAPLVRPSSSNVRDLQIRGRVQGQFGYTQAKNDDGKEDYSTFELRRVRLGMRGTLFDDFRAQVEANFLPTDDDDFSMRSAFIQWRKHKPAYIKLGYDKPVFGFEENTSSAEILTVERTLINNTLVPGPLTGLSLEGTHGVASYAAGIYTDRANRNADGSDNDQYLINVSGGIRLDDMIENAKLRFRADYLRSDDDGGNFGGTYERDAMALSGHFAMNGFDLRAEYMIGRDNGDNTWGWYVMPSQFLTDKLQLVARFEMAEADRADGLRAPSRYMRRAVDASADQRGDAYKAGYLGLNYYLAGNNHKFMLGAEYSELENTPRGDLTGFTGYAAWRMLF